MGAVVSRGVLFVHSVPPALTPHIEWAVGAALDHDVKLHWSDQEAAPGMLRCEYAWQGAQGSGVRIASALRGWEHLRYEVTEEPCGGVEGGRWAHTPALGIFYSQMDSAGNTLVPEDRIRAALQGSDTLEDLRDGLALALGQAWDDELEVFRHAGAGAPVRMLNQSSVG